MHNRIVFMDETRGIFGSSPTEPIHCVRKGAIEICCKLIMNEGMSKQAQAELGALYVVSLSQLTNMPQRLSQNLLLSWHYPPDPNHSRWICGCDVFVCHIMSIWWGLGTHSKKSGKLNQTKISYERCSTNLWMFVMFWCMVTSTTALESGPQSRSCQGCQMVNHAICAYDQEKHTLCNR